MSSESTVPSDAYIESVFVGHALGQTRDEARAEFRAWLAARDARLQHWHTKFREAQTEIAHVRQVCNELAERPAQSISREQHAAMTLALLNTPGDCPGDDDIPGPGVWADYMVDALLDAAQITVRT